MKHQSNLRTFKGNLYNTKIDKDQNDVQTVLLTTQTKAIDDEDNGLLTTNFTPNIMNKQTNCTRRNGK